MSSIRQVLVAATIALSAWNVAVLPAKAQTNSAPAVAAAAKPVVAELKSKVDSKTAKVGDVVTARTLGEAYLSDSNTVLPGAILTGKVAQVQSRASGNGTASLQIIFDQIQKSKKSAPIPIKGFLIGVAPRPNLSDQGPSADNLPMASNRPVGNYAGETGMGHGGGGGDVASIGSGSSVRGVTLATGDAQNAGTLTSSKDFKLSSGMRLSVAVSAQ